ncbi:MAG TPA: polyprenyl synthetase family protein [Bacteroidota bacterium]|nr:polyprenyl synthetase family protein [Bacteroidota bacterium]
MEFLKRYQQYGALVERSLAEFIGKTVPRTLYEPAKYILAGGGKRIRPVLMLCSSEAVGGTKDAALDAAVGLEILHNFTLVHDDIMDNASSRRGRPTVHTKWDENIAILAGDVLLGLAYRALLRSNSPHIQHVSKIFTEGVIEVCEGQAYDKEFETRRNVTMEDYLLMIRKKTGTMVSVATEVGGLLGGASEEERLALKSYGELVGQAFQVQDDLLDVIADEEKFGKTIGGDIVEGKKTFLLITALERATGEDKKLLKGIVERGGTSRRSVDRVRRIFQSTGAIDAAQEQISTDITRAKERLGLLRRSDAVDMLGWFTDMLLNRKS